MLVMISKLYNEQNLPFYVFYECGEESKPFFVLNQEDFDNLKSSINMTEGSTLQDYWAEIKDLYKTKGKISAIKRHREIFNSGLKTAKDEIEMREHDWRKS